MSSLDLLVRPFAVFTLLCLAAFSAVGSAPELSSLTLPPQPSYEEIAAYLQSIMKASPDPEKETETKPEPDPSAPQVGMIAQVGPENVVFIFEALHKSTSRRFSQYAEESLKQLLNDSNKKEFLNALISLPSLVSLVPEKNWQADAKPILLGKLALATEGKRALPKNWLSQLVLLKDPQVDGLLSNYFSGLSEEGVYYLPEMAVEAEESGSFQLSAEVMETGWKHAKELYARQNSKPVVKAYYQRMAYAAAGRGNVEALQALAEGVSLDLPKNMIWWNKNERLERLRKLTDSQNDAGQFPDWIKARRKTLVFDPEKKMFLESAGKKGL